MFFEIMFTLCKCLWMGIDGVDLVHGHARKSQKHVLYTGLPAELPNYDVLPIVADYTPPSGCLSHPGASTREKGIILRDVAVANMVIAIEDEFSGAGDFHED